MHTYNTDPRQRTAREKYFEALILDKSANPYINHPIIFDRLYPITCNTYT